jgi:hypothetical protein
VEDLKAARHVQHSHVWCKRLQPSANAVYKSREELTSTRAQIRLTMEGGIARPGVSTRAECKRETSKLGRKSSGHGLTVHS